MGPEGGSQGAAHDAAHRSVSPPAGWAWARHALAGLRAGLNSVVHEARARIGSRIWFRGWATVVREAQWFRHNPLGALAVWAKAIAAQLDSWLTTEVDQRRHWLWLPVFLGCGIAWFFSRQTPGGAGSAVVATLALAVAAASRINPAARLTLIALAMIPAGYAAGALRLMSMEAPVLQRTMSGELTGLIVAVDQRGAGMRLQVALQSFADVRPNQLPLYVRVSLRHLAAGMPPLQAGQVIRAKARLMPPPEAARPGGFDFARDAWFRQIGATGSISGQVTVLDQATILVGGEPASPWSMQMRSMQLAAWIDRARMALTARITDAWGGQAGAVAAALVTGKRGQISEQSNDSLRAAGIYHIISISGLHMVLAAGMFFWTARALLALSPWCALHLPVRKIAATLAILGATAYCIFSGADVATVRSLIMIVALLGAILVDRPALSMHNLALAAMIVLVFQPESLIAPGFQMSFAAVAGLIVIARRHGVVAGMPKPRRPPQGLAHKTIHPLWGVISATLVCELATAPFSIWHFQNIYPLGLIGNAMALPFLSLVVMPAAVIGVALVPLGLDWPVWWVMGAATEPVMYVSGRIAATPFAVAGVAAPGVAALVCLSIAIVWFVIWRTPLRWAAAAPALAGILLVQNGRPPDIIVDRTGLGALVAQRPDSDGRQRLTLLGTPSGFVVQQWLRAHGDTRPPTDPSLRDGVSCDLLACVVVRDDGGAVVWVRERRAFFADCQRADVIISAHRAPRQCHPGVLLDRVALERHGAASIWLSEGIARVTRARDEGDGWPWSRSSLQNRGRKPSRSSPPPDAGTTVAIEPGDEPAPADANATGQSNPEPPVWDNGL